MKSRKTPASKQENLRIGLIFMMSCLSVSVCVSAASPSVDQIYSECCGGWSCVGFGAGGCIKEGSRNCDLLVAYRLDRSGPYARINFRMVGRRPEATSWGEYIAMGISRGPKMGDDLVVACKNSGGMISAQMSFNNRHRENDDFMVSPSIFSVNSAYNENGQFVCDFNVGGDINVQGQDFRVLTEKYHLLGAKGNVKVGGELEKHNPGENWASENAFSFTKKGKCTTVLADNNLRRGIVAAHLSFMVYSFISLIPTGMLIARFVKESHSTVRFFHLRLWHILHYLTQGSAQILIFFGVILPGVAFGPYALTSGSAIAHYVIGTLVVFLFMCCYSFGIITTFTDVKNHRICKNRINVPFTHWLLAVLAYSFGMIQLFLAPALMRVHIGWHCTAPSAAVLMWVIFHVFVYLLLSMLLYYREAEMIEVPIKEPEQPLQKKTKKAKKVEKTAKYYDEYYDKNNKRLGKKFRETKKEKTTNEEQRTDEILLKPKPSASHATFYDDFVDAPDNFVRNPAGSSRNPPPPAVSSDKDLDGIDHFSDEKSRNLRPTSSYYLGGIYPCRFFTEFPLKTRPAWRVPFTLENEIVIGIFFALSLIVSAEICYLLLPYGPRGPCEDERGKDFRWFSGAW